MLDSEKELLLIETMKETFNNLDNTNVNIENRSLILFLFNFILLFVLNPTMIFGYIIFCKIIWDFWNVFSPSGYALWGFFYQNKNEIIQNYLKLEKQTVEYYIVTLKAIISSSSDNNKYKSKHLINLFINTIILVIIILLNNII